ncbi:ankyrin repeat domain-containing protein [Paenibacillus dendritiformis]|uniref:ankyrin repeat domain-containing protein n=1 Tax=Paenibacillus dendritiformis TaxID=130049 RepID=UPI00387E0EB8
MKAIELNNLFPKCRIGPNFDVEMLYDGLTKIGLSTQVSDDVNRKTPDIQYVVDLEKGVRKNKWDDELLKECGWDIIEKHINTSENKPTQIKTRLIGKITFDYESKYNYLANLRLKLIDSNIWNIYIDGGDGDPFECMQVGELYFLPNSEDVYTDLSFDSHMDLMTTDGALFLSVSLENNINIDNLFDAVVSEDIKRIKSLLDEGKNINEKDENGTTPLMVACKRGNLKIIKFLLEHGADVNIKNKNSKTAFDNFIWKEEYIMKNHIPKEKKDTYLKIKKMLKTN